MLMSCDNWLLILRISVFFSMIYFFIIIFIIASTGLSCTWITFGCNHRKQNSGRHPDKKKIWLFWREVKTSTRTRGKHLCQFDSCLSGTYFKISTAQPEIYKHTSNTDGKAKYTNTLQKSRQPNQRRKQLGGNRSVSKEHESWTCFRGDNGGLCALWWA